MLEILKESAILYAEDEPEIQANIVEYLEEFFGTVHTAENGTQALELYEKHHPDVLLLDITLPYIDGLSIAKEIRQHDQHVKIVMLTAHTEQEKLLKATELKLTKYLIKPVTPREFKDTMQLLAEELLTNPSRFVNLTKGCLWDNQDEKLSVHGQHIDLAEKSHLLLKLLIIQKGQVVTYEDIMVTLWEDAFDQEISIGSVKNQVSLLRKKLPQDCICSVYGIGYRLK